MSNQTESIDLRRNLYNLYAEMAMPARKKIKILEALDEICGYDLIFIFGLILENKWSGNLNIVDSQNAVSGISFLNGSINSIDFPDGETQIASLLVSEGYILLTKLSEIKNEHKANWLRYLFENKLLTIQQMRDVLVLQMRLRLSKYVSAKYYKFSFISGETEESGYGIPQSQYSDLMYDWVAAFDFNWLSAFYHQWESHQIRLDRTKLNSLRLENKEILKMTVQILSAFHSAQNLISIRGGLIETEREPFIKGFHYLVCTGYLQLLDEKPLKLGAKSYSISIIFEQLRSEGELKAIKTAANLFQLKANQLDEIYSKINDLVLFEGANVESDVKLEVHKLALYILTEKKFILEELQKAGENVEPLLNPEAKEKLVQCLLLRDFTMAAEKLTELKNQGIPERAISLYSIWLSLICTLANNEKIELRVVGFNLDQVSPEVKISAEYYYVRMFYFMLLKNKLEAAQNFALCTKKDSRYLNQKPLNAGF